jgi:hypothetical protein
MNGPDLMLLGFFEGGTSLKTNPQRVVEYIKASCGGNYNAASALGRSWCADFLYWLLKRGGLPVPAPADDAARYRKIRDQKQYAVHPVSSNWTPRAGDIYYAPKINNRVVHHVGFIVNVLGPKSFTTLDGNTGPVCKETNWTVKDENGKVIAGGIGGGMVCLNTRTPSTCQIAEFVEVPFG